MEPTKWFDRKFSFASENIMPSVIERLMGTPLRIKHKLEQLDRGTLTLKPDGKWSILEHVGHLSDLESLWLGRFEDIMSGREILRPTDLANQKTTEAGHNEKTLADVLREFETVRAVTISQLSTLKENDLFRSALHPRLKTPMRMQDLFIFVAEHDDHHLAKMTAIIANR